MTEKKFILIAEDRKFYANTFKLKLTQEGHEVVIADNGDEALKMALERKPDLMLLDLMMPEKSGFETLEELKADPQLKDIPVIVMSNLAQEGDIDKVKTLGAIDYVVKANTSLQEAIEKVKSYL